MSDITNTQTKIKKAMYLDMYSRYAAYKKKTGKEPNIVYIKPNQQGDYIQLKQWNNMRLRFDTWWKKNGKQPEYVVVNPKGAAVSSSTSTSSKGSIQTACEKLLGSFTTFTQFYNKCKGRGYSYYYNDIKTLSQESSTIANLNCVDSTQLAYHLAKEMGYEFHIYRVKCTVSKSGHVYGGIKGKEFTKLTKVDMAACMSKSSQYIIGNVWCSDAKILAIDEETWLKDDGVT